MFQLPDLPSRRYISPAVAARQKPMLEDGQKLTLGSHLVISRVQQEGRDSVMLSMTRDQAVVTLARANKQILSQFGEN